MAAGRQGEGGCPTTEVLAAFVEGKLADGERDALEVHVDGCPDCAALLSAYGRELAVGDTLPARADGAATELAPGARVGRYRIVRTLASGGMGIVYLARDPEMDRTVALKLVRPNAAGGEARSRLVAEARALARLSHPNVVAAYDVGTLASQVWIAMEHVDGVTLEAWLAAERPDRDACLRVFAEAGRGLAAVHRAGFVHRDFKPANVLVGRDGRVRLLDFGLVQLGHGSGSAPAATLVESHVRPVALTLPLTRVGALLGTPAYMSPEQHAGSRVDARSDQFSFCVALYEALTGARPFAGDSFEALGAEVRAGRFRDARAHARLPRTLWRALERGLAVDPAARFPDMDALLAALAPRPAWRRIAPLGALALVAGGLAGALALVLATRAPRGEAPAPSRSAPTTSSLLPTAPGSSPASVAPGPPSSPVSSAGGTPAASSAPGPDAGGAPDAGAAVAELCGELDPESSDPCVRCAARACCAEARRCSEVPGCGACFTGARDCADDRGLGELFACAARSCASACFDADALGHRCTARGTIRRCDADGLCFEHTETGVGRDASRERAGRAAVALCRVRLEQDGMAGGGDRRAEVTAPCAVETCEEP
ncbi:MAG: protein kinase [Myxococcales bacterium]|nr:protein kinase [Myxococcales bacterium]